MELLSNIWHRIQNRSWNKERRNWMDKVAVTTSLQLIICKEDQVVNSFYFTKERNQVNAFIHIFYMIIMKAATLLLENSWFHNDYVS